MLNGYPPEYALAQHITNLESRILQYQQSINDTVNNESDTVNDTATRLITLIKAHPEYTYDEYAKVLNIGARSAPASKRSIGITHPSKTKKPFFA